MKVVPLSEAKAKLSHFGQRCHKEPVVITVNGRPAFQLVPITEKDDLIDRLLAEHPGFRSMLEARLRDTAVSASEAPRRLRAKAAAGKHAPKQRSRE